MLDHVSLGVTDLERSRRFYDAVLRPLGLVRTVDFQGRAARTTARWLGKWELSSLSLLKRVGAALAGYTRVFRAPDRHAVRAFHTLSGLLGALSRLLRISRAEVSKSRPN